MSPYYTLTIADDPLRHDVRRLLAECLDAVSGARRWQLECVALSVRMLHRVLTVPHRARLDLRRDEPHS
jgi:hypothetical protein